MIPNVDEEAVAALKLPAERNGRSLEVMLDDLMQDLVEVGPGASLCDLADRIAAVAPKAPQTDSTELIREDRAR